MARTRSKPAKSAAKESSPEPSTSTDKALPATTSNPLKLFVLPKNTSKDARIVTLDNPANDTPSRYYFCSQKGFHEFTRIAAPKKDCRSWLITGEKSEEGEALEKERVRIGSGYITQNADLFLATPIDTLFLILPAFAPQSQKNAKQHFLMLDDYLDMLSSLSRHWKTLLAQSPTLKTMIEKRVRAVCDILDVGGETMYRISHDKIVNLLLNKAERMVKNGLPKSLEEKFVKSALEVPIMSIRREESTLRATETPLQVNADETETSASEVESQESATTASLNSQASTSTALTAPSDTSPPNLQTPSDIPHLLRIRTALTYLTSSYVPATLRTIIHAHLASTKKFDALDTHLAAIAKLKSEAAALRSISDNMSRKRAIEEDEDKVAEREEKKRKKEEEEKKKKQEGRGIKQLKKVDTSGMKKMSSFFQKVAKKA